MPKENTHLYLVNSIMDAMEHAQVRVMLKENYVALCLGGIVPDTFFYSSNKDVVRVGEELHGKDGERTNRLTFELLDLARGHRCEKVLSLAMGYISHCVFDMTFHPVIYYLTGNYYDGEAGRRDRAIYRHRLLETKLDSHVNNRFYLDDILDEHDGFAHEALEIISGRCGLANGDLVKAFRTQIKSNRYFRNGLMHRMIHLLSRLRVLNYGNVLPLFYHHLKKDAIELEETIRYRDILSGRELEGNLSTMLRHVRDESIERIKAAFAYYNSLIDKAEAMRIIRGESLDTGREDCPVRLVICTS